VSWGHCLLLILTFCSEIRKRRKGKTKGEIGGKKSGSVGVALWTGITFSKMEKYHDGEGSGGGRRKG